MNSHRSASRLTLPLVCGLAMFLLAAPARASVLTNSYIYRGNQSGSPGTNWSGSGVAAYWQLNGEGGTTTPASGTVTATTTNYNFYILTNNGIELGNDTATTLIRNPYSKGTPNVVTFPGDSLILPTNTQIRFKNLGGSVAFTSATTYATPTNVFPGRFGAPGLVLDGGCLNNGTTGTAFVIQGSIYATPDSQSYLDPADTFNDNPVSRAFVFQSQLTGSGAIALLNGASTGASATVPTPFTATNNNFTGKWIVKSGWLQGAGDGTQDGYNSLGTNAAVIYDIDPKWTPPTNVFSNNAHFYNGPAVLDLGTNLANCGGALILTNGGQLYLHGYALFSSVNVEGHSLTNGSYTYAQLAALAPSNNFSPSGFATGFGTLVVQPFGPPFILAPITVSPTNHVFVGTAVTFTSSVLGPPPFQLQWQFNNGNGFVNIPEAYTNTLTLSAMLTNSGSYELMVTNNYSALTSAPVALTVALDTNPPMVLGAFNIGATNVELDFSKTVEVASATNLANYVFTNGLALAAAALETNNSSVLLTTAPMTDGVNYSLVVNGVRDRAIPPNTILTNTLVSFTAQPFASQDIGSPAIATAATYTTNGVTISGAGNYIGGTNDQFNFQYQLQTGDFDVTVCLAALGLSDLWAEAGLMARASLNAGSLFAAALATPGMNGDFFANRTAINGLASTSGHFPVNYPNTWLRLNRVGSVFTGFGSYDGTNWTLLGTASIAMTDPIYLGLAVASHNTNQPTTVQFVDYENTPATAVVATTVNPHEPLGPSSRNTGIVISEIMWKPAPRTDGNNTEFLELYNTTPWFHDISGYTVTCADMNYTFPANTLIPGGAFFVLCASPQGLANVYGLTSNVFGPYNGSLKHSETLELLDEQTNILLTVPYTDVYPWPVAADGTGHSIVLANPTYGEGDPRAWDISDTVGGSPGQMDGFTPSPLRNVFINEILPHSENPAVPQFIELYNHSTNSVNISGCILTDDPATNKFVIPAGAVIGPAGFISFTQSQFGFTLNGEGETLYFIKPDGSRVLDAVQFQAQADGVSYGRWPDGANDFYAFTTNTPGTNNSAILIGDIVINELMYDPISGDDDDQYIELYNKGTNTINLSGWQFTS
ncbi:MAG: lamin tail domain-containing protein, partial [Verrucomicrobiota bacterium]